jgi:hypothetical protein
MDAKFASRSRLRLHLEFLLDYVTNLYYIDLYPRSGGASPETVPKTERGVASPGCGANRTCGRSRTPTVRPLWPDADSRCGAGVHCRSRQRGSRPKIATVERREGVPVIPGRSAPHSAGVAPRKRDNRRRVRLSALHPPLVRGSMRTKRRDADATVCPRDRKLLREKTEGELFEEIELNGRFNIVRCEYPPCPGARSAPAHES